MNFIFVLASFGVIIYFLGLSMIVSKVDVVLASAIIITAVLGDSFLRTYKEDIVRGFVDTSTHGLIGVFNWCIVALHAKHQYIKYEIIICGILSSFVDIDHFIKARSFQIRDALYQDERPFLHCSTIPLLILVINIVVHKIYRPSYLLRYSWIVWTSFTSHHIRDANRRGLWFYPFGSTQPLSDVVYIFLTILLPYITAFLINNLHISVFLPSRTNNLTVYPYEYHTV